MKSTISSKGQVTIPVEIREELGLRPGTPVVFERHPSGALLRKGTKGEHPVDRVFGQLRLETSVDVILDNMRGPRPASRAPKRPRR
jgi:AbrB family looped-hinge helix DNA binding protein